MLLHSSRTHMLCVLHCIPMEGHVLTAF